MYLFYAFISLISLITPLLKIDVCIPTLTPLSPTYIEDIHSKLPVNRLLTSSVKGRGNARQDLINRVETDWFAFIDSDVYLNDDWFQTVRRYIGEDVGAVEGFWLYSNDKRVEDYYHAMERLRAHLRTNRIEVQRAFTGDTLIRTDAVKDIRIPNVHLYEDEFIAQHVKNKGLKWVRTKEVICNHTRKYNIDEAYEVGRHGAYFDYLSPRDQVARMLVKSPLKALYCALTTGNVSAARLELVRQKRTMCGTLHATVQGWKY